MNEINSIKRIDAFEKLFNLKLLYQIFDFAKSITNNETQKEIDIIFRNGVWSKTENVSETIQSEYDFRYFGEMLERYEERIGSDIRDVRALAIGFSMLEHILPDNAYVAGQKDLFIKSLKAYKADYIIDFAIQRIEDDDINIDCSFDSTEKLIIVLSMVRNFLSAFETLKPYLIEFFGVKRTVPVEDNCGMFDWLTEMIYSHNIPIKKKHDQLFKVLSAVGNKFLKPDSKEMAVFNKYGYSDIEVAYLSYYFVNSRNYRCRIKPNTLTGEKISVEFVIRHLNAENRLSDSTYHMLYDAFLKNSYFDIKYNGCSGILEVMEGRISIVNPHIFSKVWDKLGNHYYKYIDFFDERWDSLSNLMTSKAYDGMVIDLIINDKTNKTKMRKYMSQYHKLTGKRLQDMFNCEYNYYRGRLMGKMVMLGVMDLWKWFESAKKNNNKEKLKYAENVAFGNMNGVLFDFWAKFFDKYDISEMDKLFGSKKKDFIFFIDQQRYYSTSGKRYKFNLYKCNLTDEQMKIYLKWVEEYFFEFVTGDYIYFIQSMLIDSETKKLIEFAERKKIYNVIKKFRPKMAENAEMIDEYMSEAEKELIKKQEMREIEKKNYLKAFKEKSLFEENFRSIYDGTYSSVYKFIDSFGFFCNKEQTKNKVKPLFSVMVNRRDSISEAEFLSFLKICTWLAKESLLTYEELSDIFIRNGGKNK